MRHADWNGFTATDLVFPTFLFVVGVSIVFSTEARLSRGDSRARLAWHTLHRAAILVSSRHRGQRLPVFSSRPPALLRRSAAHRHLLSGRRAVLPVGPARTGPKLRSSSACSSATGSWCAGFRCRARACRAATFLSWTRIRTSWRGSTGSLMPGHLYEDSPVTTRAILRGC